MVDLRNYEYLLTLAKPAFAWEFARRNPDFALEAALCRPYIPKPETVAPDTLLCKMERRCAFAERWGLYILPDPDHSSEEIPPFWLPETLESTIGLRVTERPRLNTQQFDLSLFPGRKHFLVPDVGPPELVVHGPHYAGYFQLSGKWHLLPRRFYFQVQMGAFARFDPQLAAAETLYRLIEGPPPVPWRERAFGPNRLRRALICHDIRARHGGSHWDAARAVFGAERVERARRQGDDSLRQRARRSFQIAENLIAGDYRRLLN